METKHTKDYQAHWDAAFTNNPTDRLGWYEKIPGPSLDLIKKCNLQKSDRILNVGAGATTLVDELLWQGYKNIIASDVSPMALEKLKSRLGNLGEKVQWIIDDLTAPKKLKQIEAVDLWHDRAVLHFFTEEPDQDTYFELLKSLVSPKGFVIIAVFNLNGATKCSGLPVFRYNENMLKSKLGSGFNLVEAFDYSYTMPSGDKREYIYTLFQKTE